MAITFWATILKKGHMKKSAKAIVERYLRTGKSGDDPFWHAWPGEDLLACAKHGDATLRDSLISTVKTRTSHAAIPEELIGLDVATFTCKKVEPMVRGLFPAIEREPVLNVLSGIVKLTNFG